MGQVGTMCWNACLGGRSINSTLSVCLWIINDILILISDNFSKTSAKKFFFKKLYFSYRFQYRPNLPQHRGKLGQLTFFAKKCLTQPHLHFSVCSFAIL